MFVLPKIFIPTVEISKIGKVYELILFALSLLITEKSSEVIGRFLLFSRTYCKVNKELGSFCSDEFLRYWSGEIPKRYLKLLEKLAKFVNPEM